MFELQKVTNFNDVRRARMTWPKLKVKMADCFYCGMEYETVSHNRLYCSERCKATAQNKRKVAARKVKNEQ